MRSKDDCSYKEYKEGAEDAFHLFEYNNWPVEHVTNYLAEEDWYGDGLIGTSAFMWYLSVAVREIELNCFEDRVLAQTSYHIPLYEQGEYQDLSQEEKQLLDKDVEYIKAHVTLIPADQLKEAES